MEPYLERPLMSNLVILRVLNLFHITKAMNSLKLWMIIQERLGSGVEGIIGGGLGSQLSFQWCTMQFYVPRCRLDRLNTQA